MPSIDYHTTEEIKSIDVKVNFHEGLWWISLGLKLSDHYDYITVLGSEETIMRLSKNILETLANSLDKLEEKKKEETPNDSNS